MLKRLIFILAFFITSYAHAQAVIVNDVSLCASGQAPIFDPSTSKYNCGAAGGGGTTTIIGNGLLTGGGVVWTGNLNFTVGAATYMIAGTAYSSAQTNITLTAANGSNPRIDAIIVDTSGVASKVDGTAAASPALPSIDPTSQILLTFVYVDTSATTPSNFTNVDLYLENAEWTSTVSANFNAASTTNPFAGTKDIEATTAAATNYVTLTKPAAATENLSVYNNLVFYIRSKATWPNPKSLLLYWLNGTTQIGSSVTLKDAAFTFSSSNTSTYQIITIPISNFNTGQNLVTTLKAQVAGGGGTIGFYLDNIKLQGGGNSSSAPVVQFADNIVPTGAINSSNKAYVLPQVPNPVTSLKCAGNGLALKPTADYTFNANTATITTVGTFQTNDTGLVCSYRY